MKETKITLMLSRESDEGYGDYLVHVLSLALNEGEGVKTDDLDEALDLMGFLAYECEKGPRLAYNMWTAKGVNPTGEVDQAARDRMRQIVSTKIDAAVERHRAAGTKAAEVVRKLVDIIHRTAASC